MKKILFIWIMVSSSCFAFAQPREKGGAANPFHSPTAITEKGILYYPFERVLLHAEALKMYAKSNGYDTAYAFIVNMGMRSNTKRFFIVNLRSMCVEQSGVVAHGMGDHQGSKGGHQYSNAPGSNCTSLGKYRIGKSYKGFFGLAYKLYGLEPGNSRAAERNIVLHSMHCLPEEPDGRPVCVSEGCPAVADAFLPHLAEVIDNSTRPVLLWMYDSTIPVTSKHR